ncbi:hypothetical protein BC332_14876 [Capsicum chinense]|nr:hypothetical protein BC332_14876 [Capsicum chinense]
MNLMEFQPNFRIISVLFSAYRKYQPWISLWSFRVVSTVWHPGCRLGVLAPCGIQGFSIPSGLPWNLVDEVNIPINCGDEFHWVLVVVVLKERRIRVYDLMLRRRHFELSSEIQKLAKILSTYLNMRGFLDQNILTDWSTIEAYWDKMGKSFDVEYIEVFINPLVALPNHGLDVRLLRKRYAALLWKYGEAKAQKSYARDIKDPQRPKPNTIAPDEEQLVHIE